MKGLRFRDCRGGYGDGSVMGVPGHTGTPTISVGGVPSVDLVRVAPPVDSSFRTFSVVGDYETVVAVPHTGPMLLCSALGWETRAVR